MRQEIPFWVRIFAAMPPEWPEPTIKTSYSLAGMVSPLVNRIDRQPVQARSSAESAPAAAPAGRRSGGAILARIPGGGLEVPVRLGDEMLDRIARHLLFPGARHQQRPEDRVRLGIVDIREAFLELLIRLSVQRIEAIPVQLLAIGG